MDSFPQDKHGHLAVNFAGPHDPVDVIALKEKTVRGHDLRQLLAHDQLPLETHGAIGENHTARVENLDSWSWARNWRSAASWTMP